MPKLRLVSYLAPGFPASLFELIADRLDADLTLIETSSGPPPGEDPFADGSFDLGWICSTSFVELSLRTDNPSVQLTGVGWTPRDPDSGGRPVYFGDLVVRGTSAAVSLADLAGKKIGCNDQVSLSGHYALRFAIDDLGADADSFAELVFTGAHNTSIDRVLSGELDAATVDSIVLAARREADPSVSELRVLQRLGPWPVQPLVARAGLAPSIVAELPKLFFELNHDFEVIAELEAAALVRFVPTGPNHYEVVRQAMARNLKA